MNGLTLWPEWAAAIAHLDKRVENRGWAAPRSYIGLRIAIHAGRHIGGRPGKVARSEGNEALRGMAEDAGWDVRLAGGALEWSTLSPWAGWASTPIVLGAITSTAVLLGADRDQRTPWDVPDAWHWRLGDVRRLSEPVPCRGAQGLWVLPDEVAALVAARELVS